MIEVEHICLSFGKRKILEDVNLTVYDGETMVILGAYINFPILSNSS